MGYSNDPERRDNGATGAVITATGVKQYIGFKRPCTILGFGLIVQVAQVTPTVQPVLQLRKNTVAQATMTLTAASLQTIGLVSEVSSLMKSRSPVAPDANMDPFDVVNGDQVDINVSTAEAATTPSQVILYILLVPKGSL